MPSICSVTKIILPREKFIHDDNNMHILAIDLLPSFRRHRLAVVRGYVKLTTRHNSCEPHALDIWSKPLASKENT